MLRTKLGLRRTGCGLPHSSITRLGTLSQLSATPRLIELHMAAIATRTVMRRIGAPPLHRTVPATGTRELLWIGLIIRPMHSLTTAVDADMLAGPSLLPHNAIMRSPIADVLAAPARILLSRLSPLVDDIDIAVSPHARLMHPAHAMDNLAAAVAA